MRSSFRCRGFTLMELLVVVAVVGMLASAALARPSRQHAQQQLDIAMRRLRVGLDRGRLAAERSGIDAEINNIEIGANPFKKG